MRIISCFDISKVPKIIKTKLLKVVCCNVVILELIDSLTVIRLQNLDNIVFDTLLADDV